MLNIWLKYLIYTYLQLKVIKFCNYVYIKYFNHHFSFCLSLIFMIAKWWKALNVGEHAGTLLTDLSKAFDCNDRG